MRSPHHHQGQNEVQRSFARNHKETPATTSERLLLFETLRILLEEEGIGYYSIPYHTTGTPFSLHDRVLK
jgi:hypothetical protein